MAASEYSDADEDDVEDDAIAASESMDDDEPETVSTGDPDQTPRSQNGSVQATVAVAAVSQPFLVHVMRSNLAHRSNARY